MPRFLDILVNHGFYLVVEIEIVIIIIIIIGLLGLVRGVSGGGKACFRKYPRFLSKRFNADGGVPGRNGDPGAVPGHKDSAEFLCADAGKGREGGVYGVQEPGVHEGVFRI